MTIEFTCGDPAGLAGYLYDECDPAERAAIEAHLAACASCAADLAALGTTRTVLASWTPPETELGFRLTSVRERHAPDKVLRPRGWWQRPLPAWAQAAAAILIFAAGASVGMQTSSPQEPTAAPRAASVPETAGITSASAEDLAALEQRLRDLMHREVNALRAAAARPVNASSDDEAIIARVRTLLAESEQRQERLVAFRLAQAMRDVDTQRSMDMARIQRTFGQIEGVTRPELAEQREAIRYLIQRTGTRAPQ